MGTDAYVMPLWRFKAGEFHSPITTALGMRPITLSGAPPVRWYRRLLAHLGLTAPVTPEGRRQRAHREMAALQQQLAKLTGVDFQWPDTGEVQHAGQFRHAVVLRAFAAWLSYRDTLPEFTAAPEHNYYAHPIWRIARPPYRQFPTLIRHHLSAGYLFPVEFEGIHEIEPFEAWGRQFHHQAASTFAIQRELDELLPHFATVPTPEASNPDHPIAQARRYAEELHRLCRLSLDHRLPVIFHG